MTSMLGFVLSLAFLFTFGGGRLMSDWHQKGKTAWSRKGISFFYYSSQSLSLMFWKMKTIWDFFFTLNFRKREFIIRFTLPRKGGTLTGIEVSDKEPLGKYWVGTERKIYLRFGRRFKKRIEYEVEQTVEWMPDSFLKRNKL